MIRRLLAAVRADGMHYQLPTDPRDIARDTTVQRLRQQTVRAYRTPSRRALTWGLLEMIHLRLGGHFEPAAVAARQLRSTLDLTLDVASVPPTMSSVLDLQSGITLHIAGDDLGAAKAYEAALYWADLADNAYQQAGTTGMLALHAGQRGDTSEARHWVARCERHVLDVRWGARMLERGAVLARAFIALSEMDMEAFDKVLAELPATPDNDEFWPIHAQLIALHHTLNQDSPQAVELVQTLRRQRGAAAESVLARRSLEFAEGAAALLTGAEVDHRAGSPYPLVLLAAYRQLALGDRDGVRVTLSRLDVGDWGARWSRLERQLRALLDQGELDGYLRRTIDEILAGTAELSDVAVIQINGLLKAEHLSRLPDEQRERLTALPVLPVADRTKPRLTPRETEVLRLLREGRTRREIAEASFVSENTVKSQLRTLYQALGVNNMTEALAAADRWGL